MKQIFIELKFFIISAYLQCEMLNISMGNRFYIAICIIERISINQLAHLESTAYPNSATPDKTTSNKSHQKTTKSGTQPATHQTICKANPKIQKPTSNKHNSDQFQCCPIITAILINLTDDPKSVRLTSNEKHHNLRPPVSNCILFTKI